MFIKKLLVMIFKRYALIGVGRPSARGCYETPIPKEVRNDPHLDK